MKHKHYDMIVAWAAGETIQFRAVGASSWTDFSEGENPSWIPHFEYRIKPKESVLFFNVYSEFCEYSMWPTLEKANAMHHPSRTGVIKVTVDLNTNKIISSEVVQ